MSKFRKQPESWLENILAHDYLQEGDAGFKKLKKKKRPSRRQQLEAEDRDQDPDRAMDVDEGIPDMPRIRDLDSNFVDDDELQAALARARKNTLHRRKKLSPEEIAKKGLLDYA